MELKWFMYFLMFIEAYTISSQAKELHSFRCLLEDTFEPCIVFPETSSHNVSVFSYKLINEYANLSADIHYAIEKQNLTLISEENLEKLPDALLLLLPVNHLSSINSKYLMNLIIQRSNSIVVKHLVKAYLLAYGDEYIYEKLQTLDLPVRSLRWIADVISSDSYGANEIMHHPPLLFYSPPYYLLFNNTSEKLFYLSLWEKSNNISNDINQSYLRFWAYTMIKNSFPGPLNNWNDLCLERWGTLLTACTSDELKLLNHSNIDNLQLLFSFGFSTIQVRTIFEEFREQLINSKLGYITLSNWLINLLPDQLLLFSKMIPYMELLKVLPSIKSIATSKQIFELLMLEKQMNNEDEFPYISNFSYILPLKTLSHNLKQPLPFSSLIKIQSSHFSKSQLYILSSRSEVFDFSSEYIFECRDFIKVLPARDIMFNQTASHVLLHLLSEVAADNIPQSFSVFNKLWTLVGSSNVFKKILANTDSDVLLEYIPYRTIAKFVDSILITIGEDINSKMKLPDSFVSSLIVSLNETKKNFSLLNTDDSLAYLFNGISCDDVSSLDPYDFVVFMSKFSVQRKASGKDFPKTLQQCCVEKFFAYLELKSSLIQGILGDSKLSLLNEAEIDSIGGYIFSALPVKPVAKAKYSRRIIKSIGELSLTELIMAAPISRLKEFGTVLINDDCISGEKIDLALFDLGNLTIFLDEKYIKKINGTYFKLLLESNYIDRRVCTNKRSRLAWFNFLKQCFGETSGWTYQTLVTLGDLLIIVPAEELDKIPSNSWKYAADVLTSHYHDIIKYSSSLKFYEVCMLQLNSDEAQWFFTDLKKFVRVLVDAAQLQLNTVTTVKELENKKNTTSEIFTFMKSRKGNIKVSIPENLINTEKPVTERKTTQVTESLSNDSVLFSNSDLEKESSSTTRFFNIYNSDKEDAVKTSISNGCNYLTGCHSYFSEGTSMPYLGSTTESFSNDNLYSNDNEGRTTKEINEKTGSVIEKPIFIMNNTKEVNRSNGEPSTFFNTYEKQFYLTTPLDDITYSKSSNSNTEGPSSTLAIQDELTQSSIGLSSKTPYMISDLNNSDFEINLNDSLITSDSVTTPNNIITTDGSQTNVTMPIKSEEVITDSFNFSEMSSTTIITSYTEKIQNEFKVVRKAQIENLLKDKNAITEFLNLNSSMFRSKFIRSSPVIIGNARKERVKRTVEQYSCDALKMVGKSAEILVSEELIQTMSEEDLNDCIDLFSEMDLSINIKNLIWRKLKLDHIFWYGKLISAINISDVKSMNFSISLPWALETINLIGRYSTDSEVKEHVIRSIISTGMKRYSLELLVTLGSLICELPEINSQLIEPSELLKASVVLGRSLPCDHPCLRKLSNIAVKEGAFEDPSKWNAKDVSDLGIIIAGLERIHWKILLHSRKKPLNGISVQALKCLPQECVEELEQHYEINLSKIYLKGPALFDRSVHFDFFGITNDSATVSNEFISYSVKSTSFYLGFHLQIFFIVIIINLNYY